MSEFKLSDEINNDKIFLINFNELTTQWSPTFYHKERLKYLNIFQSENYKFNVARLNKIIDISSKKSIASKVNKYIGMANIESNTGKYLSSEKDKGKGDCSLFNKGDVLFGKLRPYLNKVYLAEFDGGCTTEFIVMNSLDESIISNRFLSIFLLLDCVVNQTKHMMTGNTLPRLQTFDIENLIIPIPRKDIQQNIIDMMEKAHLSKKQKEQQAKELLESIDTYLLDELGITLPEIDNSLEKRIFEVKLSDISGDRFDPLRYYIFYKKNIEAIFNSLFIGKIKPLKSLIISSLAGDWGDDEKKIKKFEDYSKCLVLRATEFDNKFNIKIDSSRKKYRFIKKEKLKKLNIEENDILIEKSGGSPNQPVGRAVILTENIIKNNEIGYSNFIHKIKLKKDVDSQYIFNYLRVIHNKKITENMQSQTNGIRNLIMHEFLNIPIPLPPIKKQNEIAEHIQNIRDNAKQLKLEAVQDLEDTKTEVEKMILGS